MVIYEWYFASSANTYLAPELILFTTRISKEYSHASARHLYMSTGRLPFPTAPTTPCPESFRARGPSRLSATPESKIHARIRQNKICTIKYIVPDLICECDEAMDTSKENDSRQWSAREYPATCGVTILRGPLISQGGNSNSENSWFILWFSKSSVLPQQIWTFKRKPQPTLLRSFIWVVDSQTLLAVGFLNMLMILLPISWLSIYMARYSPSVCVYSLRCTYHSEIIMVYSLLSAMLLSLRHVLYLVDS